MAKFKIGDKVRVLDGSKAEDYRGGWASSMSQYVGKVYEVIGITITIDACAEYAQYRLDGCTSPYSDWHFYFEENYLEKVEEDEDDTRLKLEWNDGESGGEVGTMTEFKDINGERLCVGDVVETYDRKLESFGESFVCFDAEREKEVVIGIADARYDKNCDGRFEGICKWHIIKRKGFETLEEGFAIGAVEVVRRKRDE